MNHGVELRPSKETFPVLLPQPIDEVHGLSKANYTFETSDVHRFEWFYSCYGSAFGAVTIVICGLDFCRSTKISFSDGPNEIGVADAYESFRTCRDFGVFMYPRP
jgi:hypothetical protein